MNMSFSAFLWRGTEYSHSSPDLLAPVLKLNSGANSVDIFFMTDDSIDLLINELSILKEEIRERNNDRTGSKKLEGSDGSDETPDNVQGQPEER